MKHNIVVKLMMLLSALTLHPNVNVTAGAQQSDYRFDGTISRKVLENYLGHSVTMAFFLVTGVIERGRGEYLYREDDIRLIHNIGAKFILNWIKRTDSNGHLQMPVNRIISCPNDTNNVYRANTRSAACPIGYSQEETIKRIWTQ